jgi:hypothetical protein
MNSSLPSVASFSVRRPGCVSGCLTRCVRYFHPNSLLSLWVKRSRIDSHPGLLLGSHMSTQALPPELSMVELTISTVRINERWQILHSTGLQLVVTYHKIILDDIIAKIVPHMEHIISLIPYIAFCALNTSCRPRHQGCTSHAVLLCAFIVVI